MASITWHIWLPASIQTRILSLCSVFVTPHWLQRSFLCDGNRIVSAWECMLACVPRKSPSGVSLWKAFRWAEIILHMAPDTRPSCLCLCPCPESSVTPTVWGEDMRVSIRDQHGWCLPFVVAHACSILTMKLLLLQEHQGHSEPWSYSKVRGHTNLFTGTVICLPHYLSHKTTSYVKIILNYWEEIV